MPNRTEILLLLAAALLLAVSVVASMARRRGAAALCGWLGVILGIAVLTLHALQRGDWFPLQDNFDALAALGVMLAGCVLYVQLDPPRRRPGLVRPSRRRRILLVAAAVFGEAMPRGNTAKPPGPSPIASPPTAERLHWSSPARWAECIWSPAAACAPNSLDRLNRSEASNASNHRPPLPGPRLVPLHRRPRHRPALGHSSRRRRGQRTPRILWPQSPPRRRRMDRLRPGPAHHQPQLPRPKSGRPQSDRTRSDGRNAGRRAVHAGRHR
jgi:hypothetical protein